MESYVKNVPSIPCSYLPFIGHGHAYIGKTSEAFFNLYRQFVEKVETPSKFYLGPFLVINLDKPEDVKTVLMSSSCLDRPYFYQFLPNTTGLFTIKCNLLNEIIDFRAANYLNIFVGQKLVQNGNRFEKS